jgi:1-acyl-sn-glycerol-3-phosphate acyltransferase
MAENQAGEPDSGATLEFSAVGRAAVERDDLPAAPADDLRGQLPGLEADRQVTDWGRSQRVEGLVDRTVYRFLYNYWFRVEAEGVANVPLTGGALLLANRAGALPSDGAMVAKAVRDEHPRQRPVHLATERSFKRLPGLGMLVTKVGGVHAHPANLHRLLFDERELVLAFPEGARGVRKSFKERYRLRPFGGDLIDVARRARVPIVPVAVMGAEESVPVLGSVGALGRLPRVPIAPALPLPAKFRIRFLEPIAADARPPVTPQEVEALIQENLLEMVAGRRSVWLG